MINKRKYKLALIESHEQSINCIYNVNLNFNSNDDDDDDNDYVIFILSI